MADGSLHDKPQACGFTYAWSYICFFIKISQAFTLSHSRCNRTCHEFQAQDYAETIIDLIIDVWGLERDVRELAIWALRHERFTPQLISEA